MAGGEAVPPMFQGVSKAKIVQILTRLNLGTNQDLIDGVYALLDNETPNWFRTASESAKFSDGASTAHLASHIGVLQRGATPLDREGRDYWIKPLRNLGGIEKVFLFERQFIAGHPVPKSPNSAYRLSEDFKAVLLAPGDEWPNLLSTWASQDVTRLRQQFQAQTADAARLLVGTGHRELIQASIEHYARQFLPGYQVIYVDDGDGDRITDEHRVAMTRAGVNLRLDDAMPDALLWNPTNDRLWAIEAVTSDGEVDLHKFNQLTQLATRCGKAGVDFTTSYQTWSQVAARQSQHRNIAVGTYIWILADAARHFKVESFV